jgi:alpha-beta hydrolase superfamily lysophospholipase
MAAPLLRKVTRLFKRLFYILMGFIAAVFIIWAFMSRTLPDLELWHTIDLENEFKAADAAGVGTFESYQTLEERLFEELHRKVVAQTGAAPYNHLNRYHPEGANNALRFRDHWNRSYELVPAQIRGRALLLHGLSDSPYSLREVARILSRNGIYVLGLRLPGHGTIPAGINTARVEDWMAAINLGTRHVLAQGEPTQPFIIVGYSNGAALAIKYTLDALEEDTLTVPDHLILFSPAVGVTPLAAMADWHKYLSFIPFFEKFQWSSIRLEYDPYKYTSFPKNAGQQTYNLTKDIRKRMNRLKTANRLSAFPPTLTFQSVADSTVSTQAVVRGLYEQLQGKQHELVLFDVNRHALTRSVFKSDFQTFMDQLWKKPNQTYRLTMITNVGEDTSEVLARTREAHSNEIALTTLGLRWPEGVYSLSHLALPFSPDDPLYGNKGASRLSHGVNLGALEPRGETNVLQIPLSALMRLRYNPFFAYIEARLIETTRQ